VARRALDGVQHGRVSRRLVRGGGNTACGSPLCCSKSNNVYALACQSKPRPIASSRMWRLKKSAQSYRSYDSHRSNSNASRALVGARVVVRECTILHGAIPRLFASPNVEWPPPRRTQAHQNDPAYLACRAAYKRRDTRHAGPHQAHVSPPLFLSTSATDRSSSALRKLPSAQVGIRSSTPSSSKAPPEKNCALLDMRTGSESVADRSGSWLGITSEHGKIST